VLTTRPHVAELAFQLYGRSLHPELFQICKSRTVERGGYKAKIDITTGGHMITWRYGGMTLTEVAAAANQPLPQKRRLLWRRLRAERQDRVECRGGVAYTIKFQLEPVDPQIFWNFQQELAGGETEGLLHRFEPHGRLGFGAISYVNIETRNRSMLVQAFHTFPDDYAIVKSQSWFELP
jgi:hypothetical protein